MELKIKSMLSIAMMAAATLATVSCSDDDNNNSDDTIYSDRSYGQKAITACNDLVNGLESAQAEIASSSLTAEQEAYLKEVIANYVDNVVVPTYTTLADKTEELESELQGLDVNSITQSDINKACASFKEARKYWEQSEAFLGGAASDFDIDPTIDSWPLNRSLLLNYFKNGMTDEIKNEQSVLGFHALEFILFRNGQPRKVAELQANDTYTGFSSVTGAQELEYAQKVCQLLKERTFQLQVAWEGKTEANAARVAVLDAAKLGYTTEKAGISYGENMKKAGSANSTFSSLTDAIAQILSDDEGSAAAIANEVGTAKIANPFSAGYIFYVESPYSYNSIADFQDNIRSVRNVWYGTTNGSKGSVKSFYSFFNGVGSSTAANVEKLFNDAISKIGAMPAPFVKYCSTVWNLPYEDDDRTADDLPEEDE